MFKSSYISYLHKRFLLKKVMELAIMKNAGWQSIGFLLLIFILTVGLSYLAFNENSSEVDNEERRMSIALVNEDEGAIFGDRKSTRLNSSHVAISYAVFCL